MKKLLLIVVVLLSGLLLGILFEKEVGYKNLFKQTGEMAQQGETRSSDKMAPEEDDIIYWVAPMDPNYRSDAPGKSPMGMDLIPVYASDQQDTNAVTISPEIVQSLGVRTDRVQRGRFSRLINTVGYVEYDETLISHIHLRVDGWIHGLVANAEGERINKGQLLFRLYSPALINAQQEYLQVLGRKNEFLVNAAREKLLALGLNTAQVDELKKRGKPEQYLGVYAPQSGVIANLNVREGFYVTPDRNVLSIAGLHRIWMQAEVLERQVNWVKEGQSVEATLPSSPGKKWIGEVDYLYPELDKQTRTLRVRLVFDNKDEYLKPNMYAYVSIINEHTEPVMHIDRQALIMDGRMPRVIVALGDGRFEPRKVKVGMVNDERAEILEGLESDELVVTSGQFLIDSEASLKGALERMQPVQDMPMQSEPDVIEGIGKLNAVNIEQGQVNINHEPIPRLEWPAMVMDIDVAEDINLERVSQWQQVRFFMMKDEKGTYFIRRIEPVSNSMESMND